MVAGPVFHVDDLSGAAAQALVARHLRGMHENSPEDSCFALDVERLRQPGVTFWTCWLEGQLAGMGALKALASGDGEIKSMRVDDAFLGRGLGRAILDHILAEAQARGMTRLWLETGSAPAFVPAIRMYETAGFERCGPFADYRESAFSIFMMRALAPAVAA
ncbi:MAG: GNAT family N-acetyltransferase [Hyphomonadaceae bacterium]